MHLPFFMDKTLRAKTMAIHRFMHSMGLIQHAATNTAQKHFTETMHDAKDFIAMIRVKVQGRDPNDILNMDQTIPYFYPLNKMLKAIDLETIQQRSSTAGTKCVKLATTVTANVKMLTSFLIFKGA